MRKIYILLIISLLSIGFDIKASDTLHLSLQDVIIRAKISSTDAINARHSFLSEYWNWRSFKANYLPALNFSLNPTLQREINKVTLSTGEINYVEQNIFSTNANLSVIQNVAFSGGTFYVNTSAERIDQFSTNGVTWRSNPVNIGYQQNLFGYNSFKWERKLMPLKFQEAQKRYIETIELVNVKASDYFFSVALAKSAYKSAWFYTGNLKMILF